MREMCGLDRARRAAQPAAILALLAVSSVAATLVYCTVADHDVVTPSSVRQVAPASSPRHQIGLPSDPRYDVSMAGVSVGRGERLQTTG